MVDYRGKTYMGMLEKENERLNVFWQGIKDFAMARNIKTLLAKIEELEKEIKQ